MKIILQEKDRILAFNLGNDFTGNFWISDSKKNNLVNIEGNNNKWILKNNEEYKILKNVNYKENELLTNVNQLSELELSVNLSFFIIELETKRLLKIFCMPTFDSSLKQLVIDLKKTKTIVLGNDKNATINCSIGTFAKEQIVLSFCDTYWVIENKNPKIPMYINNILEVNRVLGNGEKVFIDGIVLYIINNLLIINNPNSLIYCDSLKLANRILPQNKNIEYNTEHETFVEFFNDNEYFQRPPRFKRTIEEKDFNIDPPPNSQGTKNEMPLIYTMGPMMLMGMSSLTYGLSAVMNVINGKSTFKENMSPIIMTVAMLGGTLIFPLLQQMYIKSNAAKKERKRKRKYKQYIDSKKEEILQEIEIQRQILIENNVPLIDVAKVILTKGRTLWDRKVENSDFLDVRLGIGNVYPIIKINIPEEHFTLEEDKLDNVYKELFNLLKTIDNVPVTINLLQNTLTGFIGDYSFMRNFLNGIMLQLFAFHSYDNLKIVIISSKEKKNTWQKYRNIPHFWNNEKIIRYIGFDSDDINKISNELIYILNERIESIQQKKENNNLNDSIYKNFKEHYLIISDDIGILKTTSIYNELIKQEINIGMSMLIITENIDSLPNECVHFVNISSNEGYVFEAELISTKQKHFVPDIPNFNLEKCYTEISNIPIDIAAGKFELPKIYSFLEMYDVGNVKQLNIANRWKNNNILKTLSAPVGINEQGELFKIDLHEKAHGPHGLVAGMTGSGKSEWIITYILSMCVNYHPDEVQFVLIDYKGGGLAGTFENKETGIRIPHLAGTITNLDISEINRSLASINSELKRRQSLFNEARDKLGESSVDIYKYQKWYRDKKIDIPISHLFIISDEFAELKSQQPEFMQELISTARIGRSLGVHLILATQKPSGVVDEQIWSNSKFRVCLKVQDKNDSNDMIRCPDAALLKETGRFYLQVGYNEFFAKGQSAYAGAPYYESDKHKQTVNTDITFIDETAQPYKDINFEKKVSNAVLKGEELPNILKEIISVNEQVGNHVKNLWLDAIPSQIYIKDLLEKYEYKKENYILNPVIGEYDAPQYQKQALLTLPLSRGGNTLIYGIAGSGKENLLSTIVYSLMTTYFYKEVNLYILDFGAETLNCFKKTPIVGDVILSTEQEKVSNYFRFIEKEFIKRKKMFQDYNGDHFYYISKTKQAIPIIVTILNNYENFEELYGMQYSDILLKLTREAEKCGILFIVTANTTNGIKYSLTQNFKQNICLRLKDDFEYKSILGTNNKIIPASFKGRGAININGEAYEFQTAFPANVEDINEYIINTSLQLYEKQKGKAPEIKILPEIVDYEYVKAYFKDLTNCPIGVELNNIEVIQYNFLENKINIITAETIETLISFSKSIINLTSTNSNIKTVILDGAGILENLVEKSLYLNKSFDAGLLKIQELFNKIVENSSKQLFIYMYGFSKIMENENVPKVFEQFINNLKNITGVSLIICEGTNNILNLGIYDWYKELFNGENGIFIGNGIDSQMTFPSLTLSKEMREETTEEYGFIIKNGNIEKFKAINVIKNVNNEKKS